MNEKALSIGVDVGGSHLHALLGQVTLKPKDGELWAYPTLKA